MEQRQQTSEVEIEIERLGFFSLAWFFAFFLAASWLVGWGSVEDLLLLLCAHDHLS